MSHLRAVSRLLSLTDRVPSRLRPIALGALSPALFITPGPAAWVGVGIVLLLSLRNFGWVAAAAFLGAILVSSVAGAVAGAVYMAISPARYRASRSYHFARCLAAAAAYFSVVGAVGALVTSRWFAGGLGFGAIGIAVTGASLIYGMALGWITFEAEDPYGALVGGRS